MVKRQGDGPDDPPRFAFECPRSWDSLSPTEEPTVRHCDHCQQAVYLCADASTAKMHARVNHCVAVLKVVPLYRGTVAAPIADTFVVRQVPRPKTRSPVTVGVLMVGAKGPWAILPERPLAWLVVLDGVQRGTLFQLGYGTTIIGSGEAANVRLQHDRDIQPAHCQLDANRDMVILRDAKVEGRRVEAFELHDGDVFVVGNTSMIFKSA